MEMGEPPDLGESHVDGTVYRCPRRTSIAAGGQLPPLPNMGFSPKPLPASWPVNPDVETADWRAVCGRTARTVRRAGRALALSDPYRDRLFDEAPALDGKAAKIKG